MRRAFCETDLSGPLCEYLKAQGYTVRSEVKDCDIAALKGDDLLMIEMKKVLNIQLLVQAARRQRVSDSVYVAIPRPSNKWKWWKQTRGVHHLLRRLELGLILVSVEPHKPPVEVVFHPLPFARKKRAASRRAVLEEISRRTGDFNTAGSNRRKLVTAYRENAIRIAAYLSRDGKMSPKALRALGTGEKTYGILHRNVYGWFERLGVGTYALSPRGKTELSGYPELVKHYLGSKAKRSKKKKLQGG